MSKTIHLPSNEEKILSLKIADPVLISGSMITARDMAHKFMVEEKPDFLKPLLKNSFIYHCGPVISEKNNKYSFLSAGPTTSIREEKYQHSIIDYYTVRGVIGKGGMGDQTLSALHKHGAVYLHATGGSAALLASYVVEVMGVYMLEEFGPSEAIWHINVQNFPALVTMDSHKNSLHKDIQTSSKKILDNLLESL